jgi:hypothetical protein
MRRSLSRGPATALDTAPHGFHQFTNTADPGGVLIGWQFIATVEHVPDASRGGVGARVSGATKVASNLGEAEGGHFAGEVDHHSAGEHYTAMATGGSEVVSVDAQFIAGGFNNGCNSRGYAANTGFADPQRAFHDAECGHAAHVFQEECRGDPGKGAFNLADAADGTVADRAGCCWFKRDPAFFRQAEY